MRSHVRGVGATGDRSERFTFALNFPGGLLTAMLILFPLGLVLFLSLQVNDGALLNVDLTLSNLITALADPLYQRVIARSLLIAGLVTLATVVTAYPVAYAIAFHGGRYKALLLFLVSLPFWTSYLLRVFAWKIVLAYNGVLNSALIETRLIKTPLLILLAGWAPPTEVTISWVRIPPSPFNAFLGKNFLYRQSYRRCVRRHCGRVRRPKRSCLGLWRCRRGSLSPHHSL
jgi:ABC-type spermidine/putrescine transport system permease subunit I